ERQEPESVLQCGYAKTPLESIEKGSTLFALPSVGSYSFCLGSFGGARGDFFKSPLEQSRVPHKKPIPYLDDLRKNPIFLAKSASFP
ncbi:MAG: hypothetical protein II326_04735, partial [Clostridia bacterium]|nr:hypothetical protein [Clostridia bacterium]